MGRYAGRAKLRKDQFPVGDFSPKACLIDAGNELFCAKSTLARGTPHIDPLRIENHQPQVPAAKIFPHPVNSHLIIGCHQDGRMSIRTSHGV